MPLAMLIDGLLESQAPSRLAPLCYRWRRVLTISPGLTKDFQIQRIVRVGAT